MKNKRFRRLLISLYRYVSVFLLISFLISCCMMLFLNILSVSMGLTFTEENISTAAKLTFGNVVLLSVLLTTLDLLRRRFTLDRPVKRITAAAEKITQGDFFVRIKPQKLGMNEGFNSIADCFNKMAQELGSVETLRTDFIANVSHEMKTPLAVIHNYGTLLQAGELTEEKRLEYAKGVTDGVNRMSDMITNILRLNRLENQQIYPNNTEYDLGEQLCECLLQYENVWERANIEIETDIEENVRVNTDAELLSLVWNNLLSNAFKFTDNGGTVSLSLSATENQAVVKVKDTGIGISAEVGKHIFEKFYQGDTSRSTQGNGLGLALVRRVADIVQGEIAVDSAAGKGTAFTVKIRRT